MNPTTVKRSISQENLNSSNKNNDSFHFWSPFCKSKSHMTPACGLKLFNRDLNNSNRRPRIPFRIWQRDRRPGRSSRRVPVVLRICRGGLPGSFAQFVHFVVIAIADRMFLNETIVRLEADVSVYRVFEPSYERRLPGIDSSTNSRQRTKTNVMGFSGTLDNAFDRQTIYVRFSFLFFCAYPQRRFSIIFKPNFFRLFPSVTRTLDKSSWPQTDTLNATIPSDDPVYRDPGSSTFLGNGPTGQRGTFVIWKHVFRTKIQRFITITYIVKF